MPRSSSVRTPWIVEPAGEQTLSLSTPGCWPVSSTIFAVPSIICAAYWIADARGRPHATPPSAIDSKKIAAKAGPQPATAEPAACSSSASGKSLPAGAM